MDPDAQHDPVVYRLGPLVRPERPVPVAVLDHGQWWVGVAIAWRCDRTLVEYAGPEEMRCVAWVPGHRVQWVEQLGQELD